MNAANIDLRALALVFEMLSKLLARAADAEHSAAHLRRENDDLHARLAKNTRRR